MGSKENPERSPLVRVGGSRIRGGWFSYSWVVVLVFFVMGGSRILRDGWFSYSWWVVLVFFVMGGSRIRGGWCPQTKKMVGGAVGVEAWG
jgi:hypothetical protein